MKKEKKAPDPKRRGGDRRLRTAGKAKEEVAPGVHYDLVSQPFLTFLACSVSSFFAASSPQVLVKRAQETKEKSRPKVLPGGQMS